MYNMDKSSFTIKEANFIDSNSILFIRVKVNDLSKAVEYILKVFKDESWLKNIEEDYLRESIEACTSDTVKELEKNLHHTNGDDVSKEVGEYVVSELSRESITDTDAKYKNIPLAEFFKQKISGNPGFDLHMENTDTKIILFGEAKYVSNKNAYSKAFEQIVRFEREKNDIKDLKDLGPFFSREALNKVKPGEKGFIAAFSCTNMETQQLTKNMLANKDLQQIKNFSETICVAVEL